MRIHIIQEDVKDHVGRLFLPGSIKLDRQIPVLLGAHSDTIIGFANDLERDEALNVSVDITFRKDFLDTFTGTNGRVTDWYDFAGFGSPIEYENTPLYIVKSAQLKAINAIHKPALAILTRETNMNDYKTAHTDRHDGGPEARAQNAINKKLGAVTDNIDYANIAKQELVKYINRKAEITDGFKVDVSYLYVVWFSKTLKNWKCLVSTSLPDGMYYECTFNGETNQLYIDAYKKFDNVSVDL